MKVKGLNGRSYAWTLRGHMPAATGGPKKSSLHMTARTLLRTLYPFDNVYEEVSLPGSDGLTADFVIPTKKMLVEVHGEQHYKYNAFFHATALDFIESKKRDARKREWADLNGLTFVELPYNESVDQWLNRIING